MKKKTKFSLGMKIVTLLTVITMASVGFAAWVITAPVAETYAEGTIMVDSVTDESVKVDKKWVKYDSEGNKFVDLGDDPVIYYGAPNETISGAWLTNNSAEKENLVAYLSITVTNKSKAPVSATVKLDGIKGSDDDQTEDVDERINIGNSALADAISAGSIGIPQIYQVSADNAAIDEPKAYTEELTLSSVNAGATATFIIKVEFTWGEDFGNINAYTHFNTGGYSEAKHSQANECLTALYDGLTGLSYKLTITA